MFQLRDINGVKTLVPELDQWGVKLIADDLIFIPKMLAHVPNRRVVVQAGGNIGLWPKEWSKHFQVVYTFEPFSANYKCLTHNVREMNVLTYQAALGNEHQMIYTQIAEPGNAGAVGVRTDKVGYIPVLRIDDFNFEFCDLIQLDIEGFEHNAILGGLATIEKHKPTIVIELKNFGRRYGFEDSETIKLLTDRGYRLVDKFNDDHVFVI